MFRILAINPGSATTKIGIFEDGREAHAIILSHDLGELAGFARVSDQYEYRLSAIRNALASHGCNPDGFHAVVARGGMLGPVESGAYQVNDLMIETLRGAVKEHASNLGAALAQELAGKSGAMALVYDAVTVDEMWDFARVTGIPGIERPSIGHVLNSRAVAREWADAQGLSYHQSRLIVAHLGGGITLSLHMEGRLVDMISDDEGSFSPERSGAIPGRQMIRHIFSGGLGEREALDTLQGTQAGLWGLTGTGDTREIEDRIASGDRKAAFYFEAMAFHVSGRIGQLAAEAAGKVDQIILTGGTAHSRRFTDWIGERVSFIAPVTVIPGERELQALAAGALRVLEGKEAARVYLPSPRRPLEAG